MVEASHVCCPRPVLWEQKTSSHIKCGLILILGQPWFWLKPQRYRIWVTPTLYDVYKVELKQLGPKINPAPFLDMDFHHYWGIWVYSMRLWIMWFSGCLKQCVVMVVLLSSRHKKVSILPQETHHVGYIFHWTAVKTAMYFIRLCVMVCLSVFVSWVSRIWSTKLRIISWWWMKLCCAWQ